MALASRDVGATISTPERKSVSMNMEYKARLNTLCGMVDRLYNMKNLILPATPEKAGLVSESKKQPIEPTFVEVWKDHTDYFDYLLSRLEGIVSELEQF